MYNYNNELYHYGVPGMKWGVRRAERRQARRERKAALMINRSEGNKKANSALYEAANKNVDVNSTRIKNEKRREKYVFNRKTENAATKKIRDTYSNFNIERAKAKLNKAHKKSPEYKEAKAAFSKQIANETIFGTAGAHKIETLKQRGVSEKSAKARTAVNQVLAGIAAVAIASIPLIKDLTTN